jgi:hypothetical protein
MQTSYTDHEMRSSAAMVDGALYCKSATARRPLGRAQAGGRQAETETPIMTSTLWGFFMQLTTALARP